VERASVAISLVWLLIAAKIKSEEHFLHGRHIVILLYFTKNIIRKKGTGFSIIHSRASLQDPKVSEIIVAPAVRVCAGTMLLLLIVGNLKLRCSIMA
jgi:hypothetical protein